jgi:hypothetical protein
VRNIAVEEITRVGHHLEVRVSQAGDFSTYTAHIQATDDGSGPSFAIDPAYAQVQFSFKAGCPSRFDCKPRCEEPPVEREAPAIDYMAKDYESFRQALLDLAPQLVPDWQERHAADLGMVLVEVLAQMGDELSYLQDAVANEAYLETARQRISVGRHARLVDYQMHDGLSARTFLHVELQETASIVLPAGTPVLSTVDQSIRQQQPPHDTVIDPHLGNEAMRLADVVFETYTYQPLHQDVFPEADSVVTGVPLHANLNEIAIHPWANEECCLTPGATSADLVGNLAYDPSASGSGPPGVDLSHPWWLKPGDVLLFEEIRDPETGRRADANFEHRQIVRLTGVETVDDPLTGETLTRVRWKDEDALDFSLCVRTDEHETVSIARGNLVPADHGRTVRQWHPENPNAGPAPKGITLDDRFYRFTLEEGPLSYRLPIGEETPVNALQNISGEQIEAGRPQVQLHTHPLSEGITWEPVKSLLDGSDAFDPHFVPETDNDGRAMIRFGDDEFGRSPSEGSFFQAEYRVGTGRSGNVGPDVLTHLVGDTSTGLFSAIEAVRNPVAAWGGTDPEAIETVKIAAPQAFHTEQYRAVTEEDYGRVAGEHPQVWKAVASFRWTGSWHTVFVAIDPVGQESFSRDLEESVHDHVKQYAMAGYDIEISEPVYVPLEIQLDICAAPGHFRGDVQEALRRALSSRRLGGGRAGFFHPDNFTFGQSLFESQLYSAVEDVPGVASAQITTFKRLHHPPSGELDQGFIPAERLEILQLNDDPNFPEQGILTINMQGGK